MRIRERDYPPTTCYKMSEEEQRRRGMNGSGDAPFEDAPQQPPPSPGGGGRLKFFKDGKLLLELAQSSDGERSGWVSVPRKTFWPPSQPSINTTSLPSGPERPPSLSVSDDNTSTASSPSQRENNWKKTTPRKNISKQLELYYVHRSIFNRGRRLLTKKIRRKPFHFIQKNQYVNGNIALNGYIRVHDYSSRSSSESLYNISKFSKIHKKTSLLEVLKCLRRKIMDSFNKKDPPRPVFRPFEMEAGPSARIYTSDEVDAVASLVQINTSNADALQQTTALVEQVTGVFVGNSLGSATPHPPPPPCHQPPSTATTVMAQPPIPQTFQPAAPIIPNMHPISTPSMYTTEPDIRRWRELQQLRRLQYEMTPIPAHRPPLYTPTTQIQMPLYAGMQVPMTDPNQLNQSTLRNVRQSPPSRPAYMMDPRQLVSGEQHRQQFLNAIEAHPSNPNVHFNVPPRIVENEWPLWVPALSSPRPSSALSRGRPPKSPGVTSGRICKASACRGLAARGSQRRPLTNRQWPNPPMVSGDAFVRPQQYSQSVYSPLPQPGPSRAMPPPTANSNQQQVFQRFSISFHPNYTGPFRQGMTPVRHPRDWQQLNNNQQPNNNQQQSRNDRPLSYVTHERQVFTRMNEFLELLFSTNLSDPTRQRQSSTTGTNITHEKGTLTLTWDYSRK